MQPSPFTWSFPLERGNSVLARFKSIGHSIGRTFTGFRRPGDEEDVPLKAGPDSAGHSSPGVRWCPEEDAGWISRLLFSYVDGLIHKGASKHLEHSDLWDLAHRDAADKVYGHFSSVLHGTAHPIKAPQGRVWQAMYRAHGRVMLLTATLKVFHDVVMFMPPIILEQLLHHITNGGSRMGSFWMCVALLVSAVVENLMINVYFHALYLLSLHIKVNMVQMLYEKSIHITGSVKSDMGIGVIVNLQSNDASKLWNLPLYLHVVWNGPFQIIAVMGLLVRLMGWAPAMAGCGVTVILIPLSTLLGKALGSTRRIMIKHTDERVKLSSEIITGIKAIKLYAWEDPYVKKISELREEELKAIKKTQIISSLNSGLFTAAPVLVALAAFGVYSAMGHRLTAAVAFPALSLFNLLRFPVIMFPSQIMNLINAHVGLQRIQKFLEKDEMASYATPGAASSLYLGSKGQAAPEVAVSITQGTFAWSLGDNVVLKDLNLKVNKGDLVIVVGEVGCGKSSVLHAILQEMYRKNGELAVSGSVAYTSQDPWIQNSTLRDNVLMDRPFNEAVYTMVLDACALEQDLTQLPAGDMSEIGEKGINLSGGQKHRVALARAAYADADIYLLDDPLSAVDAHVGRQIFVECICSLLGEKTRVLVTHQLQYLPAADKVVVMSEGSIVEVGTYKELIDRGVDFSKVIKSKEEVGPMFDGEGEIATLVQARRNSSASRSLEFARLSNQNKKAENARLSQSGYEDKLDELDDELAAVSKIKGAPNGHVYAAVNADEHGDGGGHSTDGSTCQAKTKTAGQQAHKYAAVGSGESEGVDEARMKRGGVTMPADAGKEEEEHDSRPLMKTSSSFHRSLMSLNPERRERLNKQLSQMESKGKITKVEERAKGRVSKSVYLSYITAWSSRLYWVPITVLIMALAERGLQVGQNFVLAVWSNHASSEENPRTNYYLSVYFIFGLVSIFCQLFRTLMIVSGSITASRSLQLQLLTKVVRLPMSFFDAQPTGRLLNRFTKDTEAIDVTLSSTLSSTLTTGVSAIFSIIVVVIVAPMTILFIGPLGYVYYRLQIVYIASGRELKRLDSLAFSPIFSHFSETLQGLTTIRAFDRQQQFLDKNKRNLDHSNRAYWPIQVVNRWLSVRLELMGASIVFAAAVFVTVIWPSSAGLAGLAITSALNLTGIMNWAVRQVTDLEVNMNSVERVIEYDKWDEEAPAVIEETRPPTNWPQSGAISVEKLCARYRPELGLVLTDLTFSARAHEKIGVCGRTGCGKSTLFLVLYRIVEPCGGRIVIDGIDTRTIGLKDLRSRLSLVPQDPVIFSGTIRSNLDPFQEASSDAAIWESLTRAGVHTFVKELPNGLDASVKEGGDNMSVGQRQMLCMARALLRNSKVLVLDEATSNVDNATDTLIQSTIRTAFKDCTVLTIAHRLHTIVDSDRILVLDNGKLKEFDSPTQLLRNPESSFRKLVEETTSTGGDTADIVAKALSEAVKA